MAPSTQKKLGRDVLHIDILLSAVSVLDVAQSSSEIPEGIMNYPVYIKPLNQYLHLNTAEPVSFHPVFQTVSYTGTSADISTILLLHFLLLFYLFILYNHIRITLLTFTI
jgi:hypothetical protein